MGSAQPVATDTWGLFNRQPLETSATCLFHRILHLYAWHPVKLYKPADLDTCNAMEDITAEEDGKPAVEGEKRRKLLIGITSFSILLGFIMMVMGCIMLSQYSVFLDFVTRRYTETAVFLLVIGLFTMAVSGTGLYAAVMQHFCLMTVFLAVMVAVVVMEVLASVTFFALNNDPSVHSNTNAMLKKTLQRYGSEGNPPASEDAWNLIQVELQCCHGGRVQERDAHCAQRGLPESLSRVSWEKSGSNRSGVCDSSSSPDPCNLCLLHPG